MDPVTYPRVRRNELLFDEYFNTKVPDPYQWMEQSHSSEVKAYVNAQCQLVDTFLRRNDNRGLIEKKLKELSSYDQFTCPIKRGSIYFWCEKLCDQQHSVLCKSTDLFGQRQVLLDPANLQADEMQNKIISYNISPRGTYLCYEFQPEKNGESTFHFIECASDKPLVDRLSGLSVSSMAWIPDESGIFYTAYGNRPSDDDSTFPSPTTRGLFLKFHTLGTSQLEDLLCFWWETGLPNVFAEVSSCGTFLVVSEFCSGTSDCRMYYLPISDFPGKKLSMSPIFIKETARHKYVTNKGKKFVFLTNMNAPMNRLIRVDLDNIKWTEWEEIIPHNPESKLEHVISIRDKYFVVNRLERGRSCLHILDQETGEWKYEVPVPIGRITEMTAEHDSFKFYVCFNSYNVPCEIIQFDLEDQNTAATLFRKALVPGINSEEFMVRQIFYTSTDGTEIPMFLTHHKNLTMNGSAPCKLTAFGGFGMINAPSYSASGLFFMRHFGGVLAVAGIRGGGEYGQRWHNAARKEIKQNSFDDLIRAAEYLIQNKYTCTEKLLVEGRENGGLVALVCAIQRPELFGAVVADNPLSDMLRYYKYSSTALWLDEYGNPYHEDVFRNLVSYSPVHTCQKLREKKNRIPAFLIVTDPKASRVEPVHSFKISASLQFEAELRHGKPVLNWIRNDDKKDALKQCTDTWTIVQIYLSLKWIA
ncbi:hypothetical protein FBUS_07026 [Fasciolopsis buskii]|uniref:Prolyl endopeptidase n=1 Tax=Fasciolopsis buskii TaxID=27845 RepID=A0A8E0S1D0_9TREM|nr:hypothetical protein FBUS_07026 [Fasciolopsis buski]